MTDDDEIVKFIFVKNGTVTPDQTDILARAKQDIETITDTLNRFGICIEEVAIKIGELSEEIEENQMAFDWPEDVSTLYLLIPKETEGESE